MCSKLACVVVQQHLTVKYKAKLTKQNQKNWNDATLSQQLWSSRLHDIYVSICNCSSSIELTFTVVLKRDFISYWRSPVCQRVRVPRLQCVGSPLQSVQFVEQQHVERHQHHQTGQKHTRWIKSVCQYTSPGKHLKRLVSTKHSDDICEKFTLTQKGLELPTHATRWRQSILDEWSSSPAMMPKSASCFRVNYTHIHFIWLDIDFSTMGI